MNADADNSGSAQPGRRQSRRNAMMVLYKLDLLPKEASAAIAAWEHENSVSMPAYARELVTGVDEQREALDAILARHLHDWSVDRLGAVERAILRLALFELLSPQVPPEVAIDEAVELAKRYASPDAAKLVNGVLGAYVREKETA